MFRTKRGKTGLAIFVSCLVICFCSLAVADEIIIGGGLSSTGVQAPLDDRIN